MSIKRIGRTLIGQRGVCRDAQSRSFALLYIVIEEAGLRLLEVEAKLIELQADPEASESGRRALKSAILELAAIIDSH